jgi:hypothetical protein
MGVPSDRVGPGPSIALVIAWLVSAAGCGLLVGTNGLSDGADAGTRLASSGASSSGSSSDSPPDSSPESDGSTTGAATPPEIDSGSAPDSATGANDSGAGSLPSMRCGNASCTPPGEFCCVVFNDGGTGAQRGSCAPSASVSNCTVGMGSAVQCSSSTQCPSGEFCCGVNNNHYYADVSCTTAPCAGQGGGTGEQVRFCNPQVPSDCPASVPNCQPSAVLSGFNVCKQ